MMWLMIMMVVVIWCDGDNSEDLVTVVMTVVVIWCDGNGDDGGDDGCARYDGDNWSCEMASCIRVIKRCACSYQVYMMPHHWAK